MKALRLPVCVTAVAFASLAAVAPGLPADANWPSFRGFGATGVSAATGLPADWDLATGRNILWTLDVPGVSHSSPVVWGDQVLLISAVSEGAGESGPLPTDDSGAVAEPGEFDWRLYSVDRRSGEVTWMVSAHRGRPRTNRHEKASQANSTPATDGRHIVAIFASEGMYCYDMDGELLWQVDLGLLDTGLYGDPTSNWGYASSPTIHGDRVFVQVDRHSDSFIAAYSIDDGREIWRTPRSERNTWSTPTIYEHDGREVLVANGATHIRAYDPATGEEVWRFADVSEVKVPTPFFAAGKVIISGGYPQGRQMYAFDAGARGDISGSSESVAWEIPSGGPYTATPVAVGETLFSVTDQGIFSAYDLDTGERLFRQRLGGGFSASPVAAEGRVFLASEDGEMFIVAATREFELLATIDMGEPLFATPALVDGMIVVRGWSRLYGIGVDAG